MMISIEHKIAFLAMTKTASTSIQQALNPHCDIVFRFNPGVKHISYRKYQRFVQPYLENLGYADIETTCVIREPIDWLFSWYKYRSRDEISKMPQSTKDISFDEFVAKYLDAPEKEKGIGRPSRFIAMHKSDLRVDHIYKYENLPLYRDFLETRFGRSFTFEHMNASPTHNFSLAPDLTARLQEYFALEYEIYEAAHG